MGKSLLQIVNAVDKDVHITGPIFTWISGRQCCPVPPPCTQRFAKDFLRRCLSTSKNSDNTLLTPLLTQWAKLQLRRGSWRDALVTALNVSISHYSAPFVGLTLCWKLRAPRFTMYRALCENLKMINRITDAIDCFHQMSSELAGVTTTDGEQAQWAVGEQSRIPPVFASVISFRLCAALR